MPYVEAQAVRGPSENVAQGVVWHTAVLSSGDDAKKERRKQALSEAAQVRKIIEEWRARPLPEDAAIQKNLHRGRLRCWCGVATTFNEIVAELKDETKGAIPFRAVKIE